MIGLAEFLATPVGAHLPELVLDALRPLTDDGDAPEAPSAAEVLPDDGRFGPYRITRIVGRGGMGMVYEAERADQHYERRVAIKTLAFPAPGGLLARRFEGERRILAGLEHPNIARLYDAGATPEGVPYLVMEYVEGRRIDTYCDENELSIDERLALFDRVCEAVEYAHGRLVVHRDLKPGNIVVTADGVPKLLDFGVARLLDPEATGSSGAAEATATGFRALTPEYASPERLRGDPVTTSADVYALGVLLYVLLSGQHPYQFGNRSPPAVERTILERPARPPSEVLDSADGARRGRLQGDLDNIALMSIRPEAERRYASVGHLRRDIRNHLEGFPVAARPTTWRYRAGKYARRNRAGLAAAALVLLSLTGGLAGVSWQARAAAAQAERAEMTRDYLIGLFETFDPDDAGIDAVTAEELLDRGAERLELDLSAQPMVRAELADVLGRLYQRLGFYGKARPLLASARDVFIGALGEDDPRTVTVTAALASVLNDEGEYEDAETLARAVLDARRRRLGERDTLVAKSLASLASLRRKMGHLDEAGSLHGQALEIDRQYGTPERVATDLNNLSVVHYQLGEYDEARRLNEEALAIRRETYGNRHTLVATSLLNLAAARRAAGDYDEAEALLNECIELRRDLLGDAHPHLAIALTHLGSVLRLTGRLDEAEAATIEALEIRRAAFGDRHPEVAESLNNLGLIAYVRRDYAGAAARFAEAVPMWIDLLGEEHPEALTGLNNLGLAHLEAREYEAAELVLRQVLDVKRRVLGDGHPDIGRTLSNLANVHYRRGAMDEAERAFRDAIASWRSSLGDEHPTLAYGLVGLGRLLVDTGRLTEAEAPLREAVAVREAALDPGSPVIAVARAWLGLCLAGLAEADDSPARREESATLFDAALPVLREDRGPDDDLVRRVSEARARGS